MKLYVKLFPLRILRAASSIPLLQAFVEVCGEVPLELGLSVKTGNLVAE